MNRPLPTTTVEQDAAEMSERNVARAAAREGDAAFQSLARIRADLATGRVPSGSDLRNLGTAVTDLAAESGKLAAYAEARKLLNDPRVTD